MIPVLPITSFYYELRDLFETGFVFFCETGERKAIEIENTESDIPSVATQDQRADDLAFGFTVACDMSRVGFHVGYQDSLALHEGVRADTARLPWRHVNELTRRFATERAKQKKFAGSGTWCWTLGSYLRDREERGVKVEA